MTCLLMDTVEATMGIEEIHEAFDFSKGFYQVFIESKEHPRIWFYSRLKYAGVPEVLENLNSRVLEYLESGHQPASWYLEVRHAPTDNFRKRKYANIKPLMLAVQHKYHRCWHCNSLARMEATTMFDFSGAHQASYREYRTRCSDETCMVSAGDNGTFSVTQDVPEDIKGHKIYDFMVRAGSQLAALGCRVTPLDENTLRTTSTFDWFMSTLETSSNQGIQAMARDLSFIERVKNTPLDPSEVELLFSYIYYWHAKYDNNKKYLPPQTRG